jgi:hypothetical protein
MAATSLGNQPHHSNVPQKRNRELRENPESIENLEKRLRASGHGFIEPVQVVFGAVPDAVA